jgi:hypothetical protein
MNCRSAARALAWLIFCQKRKTVKSRHLHPAVSILTTHFLYWKLRRMTVVENLISKLGRQAIADACGIEIVQTYKWGYPRDKGGTAGRIPARHFQAILDLAKERGVKVDPWDLIGTHGRKAS